MKKILTGFLICILVLSGCSNSNGNGDLQTNKQNSVAQESPVSETLNSPEVLSYVQDNVYQTILDSIDREEYFVENVEVRYISQEYIDELKVNSKENIYFGYTLSELNEQFQGNRYVFSVDESGKTVVTSFQEYDDSFDQVIRNVAIGTGVILICVTVSVISAGAGAPAVSMVFAGAAKTGTAMAFSSATIGGAIAGAITYSQTGDAEEALKQVAIEGSEEFKWGAIMGTVAGGVGTAKALKGATLNGLTMNEAAQIQKESKWSLDAVKSIHSMEEYRIYKEAGVYQTKLPDGTWALIRDIDWTLCDSDGRTNIVRVRKYRIAPVDASGKPYELHHIGQKADSPLAILTNEEHQSKEKSCILHYAEKGKNVSDKVWKKQKEKFWKSVLDLAMVE